VVAGAAGEVHCQEDAEVLMVGVAGLRKSAAPRHENLHVAFGAMELHVAGASAYGPDIIGLSVSETRVPPVAGPERGRIVLKVGLE